MDMYGIGQAIAANVDENFCNRYSTADINKVIEILKQSIINADNSTRLEAGMFIDGLIDGLQTAYIINKR